MPVTIVVGGQYGSEGKGKVVALLAARTSQPWIVRCGGPNSGHTVTINGGDVVLRQVPSSSDPSSGTFCIAAGCVVDETLLVHELDALGIERERIVVDPRAVLLTEQDRQAEQALTYIASTGSGTGAALGRRMLRGQSSGLAAHSALLATRCRLEPAAPLLHDALERREEVIIEGTQGFGLSLLHGPHYPFVTSRDTTASGFASEVGLSPRDVDRIVMVVRTFPIRVGGTSGPFPHETTWEELARLAGAPTVTQEITSVTRRLRRVAHFDIDLVTSACRYNRPTSLAVMGLDRIEFSNQGVTELERLSAKAAHFLRELERVTGVSVEFAGTGFGTFDVIALPQLSNLRLLKHA